MAGSRTRHLEGALAVLQFYTALKAFDLVKKEMCREQGFTRHNGSHYYHHCVDVTQKLLNYGVRDEDILAASLLHDLIEDIPHKFSVADIERLFNKRIAHIVQKLTKWEGFNSDNPEHFTLYLEGIFADLGACLIKTSDQMHNFSTLQEVSIEKRYKKAFEMETYYIPFFKQCRAAYPRFASFFFEAKTQIEPHLWEIKEHYEKTKMLEERIRLLENKHSS